ncbi:Hypothetical Protein FCC1311_101742 [Hondaea fermentalgiana]|uniref:DUF1279 domain-containing protein n=1 Tax=Hondaea fermentalgiana TaxID=2315210 RepID=A0A2R5GZP2_9STRA|nr:Hypothetical Protein FCC1311_101742 [Hondaea fermentalgiana]|eukprot:GBG33951.1 Hypothetical Protein FCC1311_101742 [Hondaea fermentalgiana]
MMLTTATATRKAADALTRCRGGATAKAAASPWQQALFGGRAWASSLAPRRLGSGPTWALALGSRPLALTRATRSMPASWHNSPVRILAKRTLATESKETTIHKTTEEHDKKKRGKKPSSYQVLVQKYGPLVVVFHTTVWALVLVGLFVTLQYDIADVDFLLDYAPDSIVDEDRKKSLLEAAHSVYGKFAIAYALTLASGPARFGFTILVAPWLTSTVQAINSPFLNRVLLHNKYIEQALKDPKSILKMLGLRK